jgi:oligoendopeptidase F
MSLKTEYSPADYARLTWDELAPLAGELAERPLTAATLDAWLMDWSDFSRLVAELSQRRYVAFTVNTEDELAEQQYNAYIELIYPAAQEAEQRLKEKLLASGFEPHGLEVPLRNLRLEAELFRQENLPLLSEEQKLNNEYDQIIGSQTVQWKGQELTIAQVYPIYQSPERDTRQQAWTLAMQRQLADRPRLVEIWQRLLTLRQKIARNAGKGDYREYRWQQMLRVDYTPQDCLDFHAAIEASAVPAATRLNEIRRQRLGLERLRPWDLDVDLYGDQPLRPYQTTDALIEKTAAIFHRVDPQLGAYFDQMRAENLLDLDNRKGKAPGGYCTNFDVARKPFIFMNAVGIHDDVQTLLHEGGHAFHVYETAALPYYSQIQYPLEFAEVASTSMELLSARYLTAREGGFYTPQQAARARIEHLTSLIRFWPYMAVVDGFQHWAYTHADQAMDPSACDEAWLGLWRRFMPDVDWSGYEDSLVTGWQRKLHIFQVPFYYVEYGLSQMGALQVWQNALRDQAAAVASYRKALALGYTVPLPELYRAAGARLAFDAATLGGVIALAENTIYDLVGQL